MKTGFTYVRVGIANPRSKKYAFYRALVDTGADNAAIPSRIAKRLKLETLRREEVSTANGSTVMPVAGARIVLEGKEGFIDVWISGSMKEVILGVVALEALGFAVDPKTKRLIETRRMLYSISRAPSPIFAVPRE